MWAEGVGSENLNKKPNVLSPCDKYLFHCNHQAIHWTVKSTLCFPKIQIFISCAGKRKPSHQKLTMRSLMTTGGPPAVCPSHQQHNNHNNPHLKTYIAPSQPSHPIPPFPTRLGPTSPLGSFMHSAADDASCPGLMLGSQLKVGYSHLHSLDLLVFWRDGADLVAHLVAFHWHILALNAEGGQKDRKEIKGTNNSELFCFIPVICSANRLTTQSQDSPLSNKLYFFF